MNLCGEIIFRKILTVGEVLHPPGVPGPLSLPLTPLRADRETEEINFYFYFTEIQTGPLKVRGVDQDPTNQRAVSTVLDQWEWTSLSSYLVIK